MESAGFDSNQTVFDHFTFDNYTNSTTNTNTNTVFDGLKVCFLVMLIVFSTISNSFCAIVIKESQTLQTPSGLFMMHLCIWNLFCGSLAPLTALGCWIYGDLVEIQPHVCSVIAFVDTYTFSMSLWMLMAITVDKWMFLSFPMRYPQIMTKRGARLIIIALSIILLAYAMPIVGNAAVESVFDVDMWICEPQWHQNEVYNYFYVFTLYVPSFLIMLVLNIYIFGTATYQIKKIKKIKFGDQSRARVLKAGFNVSVVVFVYYLTCIPVSSMYIIEFFGLANVHTDVKFFLFWFAYIHYCVCCIIYTALNKHLKDDAKKLLLCCEKKTPQPMPSISTIPVKVTTM